uniref:NADH:ubiquinone oxidoreductase intermediate-associated protein 30 domain-containing protein n=1 Tax=Chaetoceros debilis TaxID=122233 RepID=A0A7S3PW85_9STRA
MNEKLNVASRTSRGLTTNEEEICIESFANPSHSWKAKNDPVMGGKSYAAVTIENNLAIFKGEVVDVPFLQAPGFVTMETRGGDYPDVSTCQNLRLRLRSSEDYKGYRVSFGTKHVPGNRFAYGFKANLNPPIGSQIGIVDIPFRDFTVRWDDATGDPIVTCEEDDTFCPDLATLQDIKTISIWGEGVAGDVHLEIESIGASGCNVEGTVNFPQVKESARTNAVYHFSLPHLIFIGGAILALLAIMLKKNRNEHRPIKSGK